MTDTDAPEPSQSGSRVSRRAFLGAAGAAGVAVGALAGGFAIGRATESDAAPALSARIPFYGEHQAGIATPVQNRLFFASFDATAEHAADLRELLRSWTAGIADMTEGKPVGAVTGPSDLPPEDTGEAVGLPASRLTVTVGLGPTLFERDGDDPFGLARLRPAPLADIPSLPGDHLDHQLSGGDIGVQACADDPVVAFHAVRNLARMGRGVVVTRWTQVGFGRTSSGGRHDPTPRNLQGFKDGTNNIAIDDDAELDRFVWVGSSEQPAWMHGGTYQVARRIRMFIETWDRTALGEQEATIGRHKLNGAPLGGTREFDPLNLDAKTAAGDMVIPFDAHVRLAGHQENGGVRILRRGFSFSDGIDPMTSELNAGLFFMCFQRDPRTQFVALQSRLARHDALNEYIRHEGSAVFAILPGVQRGGYLGQSLFDAAS
jgi:deferrochelatase/peroxidase EfeB